MGLGRTWCAIVFATVSRAGAFPRDILRVVVTYQSSSSSTVTPLVILYDAFFARLFLLEPTLRDMFGDNMIRQSKFLVGLVNIMVSVALVVICTVYSRWTSSLDIYVYIFFHQNFHFLRHALG